MAVAAERKELHAMIELGKKKGHLTVDDINSLLPMDVTSPEQIDEFMVMLEQNEISVVLDKSEQRAKGKKAAQPKPVVPEKEEKKEEKEDSDEQPQEDYGKSNDPVRMYLRKMGSVSLLTREGEVEIAKRIEEGENEVLDAVLHSSIAIKEIIQIGDRLRKGKMRVREVIRDAPDEDDETFDEQGRAEQVVKLTDKIRRLDRENEKLREMMDSKT